MLAIDQNESHLLSIEGLMCGDLKPFKILFENLPVETSLRLLLLGISFISLGPCLAECGLGHWTQKLLFLRLEELL